jgi:hypothetical protein
VKTDAQLKKDVESELEWDPHINAAHVGVMVENGVVSLTGHLGTYGEKFVVERAVQRVQASRLSRSSWVSSLLRVTSEAIQKSRLPRKIR